VCFTTVGAGAGADVETLPPLVLLTRPLLELEELVRRRVVVPLLLDRRVELDAVRVPLDDERRLELAAGLAAGA
jgi:hypothetical protein